MSEPRELLQLIAAIGENPIHEALLPAARRVAFGILKLPEVNALGRLVCDGPLSEQDMKVDEFEQALQHLVALRLASEIVPISGDVLWGATRLGVSFNTIFRD